MGQTLTHGVYLPEEGERNCYSGLASNWSILDNSVGTIAEHTSALSGKAPLVHTHTKSDITDFPAYGTTAGTICEGNDSRLSDARTPVAHTHTKSDVTDLLNSNFIPSANNSYDLGSSSYQWNNLYAKNYYYNGTAWGLDKANVWIAKNTYSADCIVYNSDNSGSVPGLKLRNSKAEILSTGNTASDQSITFRDKNDVAISYVRGVVQATSVALKIGAYVKDSSNNTVNTELQVLAYSNGNKAIIPSTANAYDLGTSSYKWKTLNGVNTGALSLPGAYQAINNQIKNPSDQLNAIDLNGGSNTWVSDVDCYLYFFIPNNKFTWIRIFWPATLVRCGQTFVPVPNESSDYSGFVPVPANTTVVIQVKGTQAPTFRRSACLGNV